MISIVILAGGTSRRMGTDKALLPYKESTLLNHLVDFCTPLTNDLMICSNDSRHSHPNAKRIEDLADSIGPLGGLIPAIDSSKNEWTMVLSCDMPFVNETLILALKQMLFDCDKHGIIPVSHGRNQYLCAFYSKRILEVWKPQISTNNFSVKQQLSVSNCSFVDMDYLGTNIFRNINTVQEYQDLL